MYNVAVRIVNHDGEAEDVLQDAFLDAFQKIHDFRQTSTFGAWLKQIVVNLLQYQPIAPFDYVIDLRHD